ncbi:hypothetical protein DdX_21765 [Ditylenchus destructor]|uniref:F-box domain-containing protein n=1 Tax=Ditylenchus destructor TaxID=166010 RepID=A0AAD4MEH7_9BILA|nr:hypothetical protein DdX_21765 [Ditylenchus destructor]
MSCSKPLPQFTYELLCYLNRDQLERFSIVCRPLKNFIDRYFHSKPHRVFDQLWVRGGLYALRHNAVFWHPNRDDYSAQQFLAAQESNIGLTYYSFAEMRPYLGPTVRVNSTIIYVNFTYNPDHIEEMESITYLWRDRDTILLPVSNNHRIVAEDFQPILNSPTILQCRMLDMHNAQFSFKDYKVLYTVKDFSSAVSPNAFKIVFAQEDADDLTEFRETNKTTNEKLELKKGLPVEYQAEHLEEYENYTLERSRI